MTNPERIGIEPRKDRQLIARVESTDNQDDCLAEFLAANAVTAVNADTPVTISVSDAEVAVKLLSLPPDSAHDFRSRVIFELTQSVLEPPEQFMFDAAPIFHLGHGCRATASTGISSISDQFLRV